MSVSVLPEIAALFMLVFARVGTMVMLMPGLGERFVLNRAKLAVAVFITLLMMPIARRSSSFRPTRRSSSACSRPRSRSIGAWRGRAPDHD